MSALKSFFVPYDFSEHAEAALYTAVDLAKRLNARIDLVHVVQLPSAGYASYAGGAELAQFPLDRVRESAQQALMDIVDELQGLPNVAQPHVVEGTNVALVIEAMATKLAADLIVMGTHGRTGLSRMLLGSVTERTLRSAPCPVLVVRAPGDAQSNL